MRLEHEFSVDAPPDRTFEGLADMTTIAASLPGAAVGGRRPDGSYPGRMKVKLGAVSLEYRGALRVVESDVAAGRIVVEVSGEERNGQGAASATIANALAPSGAGTRVRVTSDVTITGRAAGFARPEILGRVAERLLAEFSSGLERELAGGVRHS